MGLDLIPRIDGVVVDADFTSVVELYKVVSHICILLSELRDRLVERGGGRDG